ncbi:YeiH family protein [Candidatus Pyrohabitans sp.]
MAGNKGALWWMTSSEEISRNLPGLIATFIFMVIMLNVEAVIKSQASAGAAWADFLYNDAQVKYVMLLLIGGMIIRNTVGIPKVLQDGVNITRPIIKPGIIIMGIHYTVQNVIAVGAAALTVVVLFVLGTAVVIWVLGQRYGVRDSLAGCLGAGVGICGVSAIIATSPVVRAQPTDLLYSIATILLFGTVMLFVTPYIGTAVDMPQSIFGAWVATSILNTAQLTAAAEWYSTLAPEGAPLAIDSATIVNIVRVVFIPIVVLAAIWYYIFRPLSAEEAAARGINKMDVIKEKFPIFVLGFFVLVIFNSIVGGVEKSVDKALYKDARKFFFAWGFAGIGLNIVIEDLKKAGGAAFSIGIGAGIAKAIISLLVIYAFGPDTWVVTK